MTREQKQRLEWLRCVSSSGTGDILGVDAEGNGYVVHEDGSWSQTKVGGKGAGGGVVRFINYPEEL